MCGICGVWSADPSNSLSATVAAMNAALLHRGPDDGGQRDDATCSLAMRRLSIIDLTTGHQPIDNEDGTLTIVFNGEIYNFKALRKQLEATGRHQFRTHSDTEVIVHLYEEYGTRTPALLHGMFAFCIHDRRARRLFFARDRFGEKPLFYSIQGGDLGFSSEIASILKWPRISRKLNFEALYYLLHPGYIPAPLTLFEGVNQLPAGHWMCWEDGRLNVESFYDPAYTPDPDLRDERVAVEALRDTLLKAVAAQMVADVPLGAFLSGGIDSTTVVAAMQQVSSRPVKTFTVRFEHRPFDESPVARAVARHLATDHHEFVVANSSFDDEDLWRIVQHFGQPFTDSTAIPTYFISRETRRHVTVAISGDGGDEIFAGYRFFSDGARIDRLAWLPNALLSAGARTLGFASRTPSLRDLAAIRVGRRAIEIARLPAGRRPGAIETLFDPDSLAATVSPWLKDRWGGMSDAVSEKILDSVKEATRLRQFMHYRVKYSLAEDMLPKVDRMSMAASLEVRAPLLSAEVTDFARRLPDDLLIRRGVRKYIMREVGRPWLPDIVYSRPKTGFSIPLHMFQNESYRRLCRRYVLDNSHPVIARLFNREALAGIIERGTQARSAQAGMSTSRVNHQLWVLVQIGAWARHFDVSL